MTIEISTDPLIVLARSLETDAQAITKRYDEEVVAVQAAAYPKIGQAVFAVDGARAYPHATGTLRLSYGTVKGYLEDGKKIPPYTSTGGLYERAAQHAGQPDYALAPKWVDAKAALDPKTPFNFASTNDIVGGSSGSPVVNRRGEIVGLIFDGNLQMLPGYFIYVETVNRAVEELPEELRTAITLGGLEGLSYEEIASIMSCPIGTVRSRIFRAREAIAEKLRPQLETRKDRLKVQQFVSLHADRNLRGAD